MKKIVIIDNYDSFTYNLSHLVKELGAEVTVYRNDQFEMSQDCCSMSSRPTQDGNLSSACVSATKPSARCSAAH